MRKINRIGIVFLFYAILLPGCNHHYTPKPRGYFRIELPPRSYHQIEGKYPYSFDVPDYSRINPYQGIWKDADTSEYWINIEFPVFKGRIHLTYKTVHDNLARLIDDAHTFAFKHTVKADAIIQSTYSDPDSEVYGVLFDIKGNTASSLQFFVTDSTRNFLRGALYFDAEPNKDSLAPVMEFLRMDVLRMVETLRWKKGS
jgi:gliding motility-associated lipoprotein GldD